MKHLIGLLFSARYRRLCRAREERLHRNAQRARRERDALRAKLTADYLAADDYGDARRLMFLLMKLDLHEQLETVWQD